MSKLLEKYVLDESISPSVRQDMRNYGKIFQRVWRVYAGADRRKEY